MKKLISLILVFAMCIGPAAFCAAAAEDDTPSDVCYVTLPESNAYIVEPAEGYDCYVVKGDEFKFRVTPKEGYSLDMAMVYYFPTDVTDQTTNDEGYFKQELIRDPASTLYTIDTVNTDITIAVDQVLRNKKANFFRSLMEFIHMLFAAIAKLFGGDIDAVQP